MSLLPAPQISNFFFMSLCHLVATLFVSLWSISIPHLPVVCPPLIQLAVPRQLWCPLSLGTMRFVTQEESIRAFFWAQKCIWKPLFKLVLLLGCISSHWWSFSQMSVRVCLHNGAKQRQAAMTLEYLFLFLIVVPEILPSILCASPIFFSAYGSQKHQFQSLETEKSPISM